jgi:hypothetical protein
MPILDDLALYLEQQGVGTRGTNLFANWLPDAPSTCVILFEYGGLESIKPMAPGANSAVLEMPFIQILARSTDPVVARARAQSAFAALDGYRGTLNGATYGWITANQPPFFLQRDQNDRTWFSFNVAVKKSKTT